MSASHTLHKELRQLRSHPVEGFTMPVPNEKNMLQWDVAIFGPPATPYQGGYFRARLNFPTNYPFMPPKMHFLTSLWHPNIYRSGEICISILHPPIEDPLSGESVNERWNPTLCVRTILLSVISMLSEPNISSPANVDASMQYRQWKEHGKQTYVELVKRDVERSRREADQDGVVVPENVTDYLNIVNDDKNKKSSESTHLIEHLPEDVFQNISDDDSNNSDSD